MAKESKKRGGLYGDAPFDEINRVPSIGNTTAKMGGAIVGGTGDNPPSNLPNPFGYHADKGEPDRDRVKENNGPSSDSSEDYGE